MINRIYSQLRREAYYSRRGPSYKPKTFQGRRVYGEYERIPDVAAIRTKWKDLLSDPRAYFALILVPFTSKNPPYREYFSFNVGIFDSDDVLVASFFTTKSGRIMKARYASPGWVKAPESIRPDNWPGDHILTGKTQSRLARVKIKGLGRDSPLG